MTQYITDDKGNKTHVVIALKEYQRLLEVAEMEQDIRDFDQIISNDDEILPATLVERLCGVDNKLLVWREYRGLSQAQLAETVGVSKPYISMLETNQKTPSIKTLKAIANALSVDLDDLADF